MDFNTEPDPQWVQDNLLNHVVFPRCLPSQKPRYHIEMEIELMNRIVGTVETLTQWVPSKTVDLFNKLRRIHMECTPNDVAEEIRQLQPGDTFPMFVRRQNTAIMIHMPADVDPNHNDGPPIVIFATFPGSLHPGEVYKHDSDIEFNYPMQAIKVKFSDVLKSNEFANQLNHLFYELPMETKKRNAIDSWLLTLLMDETSATATADEFCRITKKVRDEAIGENNRDFFRRSNFYGSVKVMLQHSLTMQLGPEIGKFLYKIVMLNFINQMCEMYKSSECVQFDVDLMAQTIAKMARRIEKLAHQKPDQITAEVAILFNRTIRDVKETIEMIRGKIDIQIAEMQEQKVEEARLKPITALNFQRDSYQKMSKLQEYLKDRSSFKPKRSADAKYKVQSYNRYYTKEQQPGIEAIEMIQNDPLAQRIHWVEFENWILYRVKMNDSRWTDDELRQWFSAYIDYGAENYRQNQLFMSRMMLVCMKLIAVLDGRTVAEHPLLREHRTGINPNIINSLLLPQRCDMIIAHKIERYFRDRNANAFDPSLIEEKMVGNGSFAVKFARQDLTMRAIHKKILMMDEMNVQKMKTDWTMSRERVAEYRENASRLECQFFSNRYNQLQHHRNCKRCKWNQRARNVRLDVYEHLLPEEEFEQLAVVFELRIPQMVACLRDILYRFAKLCTGSAQQLKIKANWVEGNEITALNKSTAKYVALGSTVGASKLSYHVDNPCVSFVIPNTWNCMYHAHNEAMPPTLSDTVIKKVCTFSTSNEYACLQWTLETTTHTENQVLARQSECPQSLTLSEFKSFGTLRADGHRLQLRKLFAMIETEALSFEKESVLCLIMQTLWECGVSGEGNAIRESHMDFANPEFCLSLVELLGRFIEQQKDNWMHPFKLVAATFIAVRVFEITDDDTVADEIMEILINIRIIALDWIAKIENVIHEMKHLDATNERELRLKLIYVAIAGALTFFVHSYNKFYKRIFSNDVDNRLTAFRAWLELIITINNNILLYECNEDRLPALLKMLMHLIQTSGIYLEPKMKELMSTNEVYEVIQKHWPSAKYGQLQSVNFHRVYPHILAAEIVVDDYRQTVTIDIVMGGFLVAGNPVSRLPNEITRHENYQWFFGNSTFEVQPDNQNNFCTVQKNCDIVYEFSNKNGNVIVTERREKDLKKELVPNSVLAGDFAYLLVTNYSHWWNQADNCIEFRKKTEDGAHFSKDIRIDYRLDLDTSQLIEVKTQRPMLDIKTSSYRQIVNHVQRLEHPKYIHVLLESEKVAIVELLRMKLKFKLDCSEARPPNGYQLQSNEFSEMCVSINQNIGTLYGLNNGLVLESETDESSTKTTILLMPHGRIQTKYIDTHVTVDIDTKDISQNPPFYQYQVDEFCRQLKAINSSHAAWFYLAYLHAVTSHGEIEPFLGMSGTERALQILQSAFVWSSSPFDSVAAEMLKSIAALSPVRKLNAHFQSVAWPSGILPRAAQDSFVFIAKKLLEDSERLHGLHINTPSHPFEFQTNLKLNMREYRRCLQTNPNLRVADVFVAHEVLKTSMPEATPFDFHRNTQIVSSLYHRREYFVPNDLNLWSHLVIDRKILKGLINEEAAKLILSHCVYEDFVDLWISLYDAARMHQFNREHFATILSLFAHQNCELSLLLALQAIATNPMAFSDLDPPTAPEFMIEAGTFSPDHINHLIRSHYNIPINAQMNYELNQRIMAGVSQISDILTQHVSFQWPCDSVNLRELHTTYINMNIDASFDINAANVAINQQLHIWNNNRRLIEFIGVIENRLKALPPSGFNLALPSYRPFAPAKAQNWAKFEIDIDEKVQANLQKSGYVIDEAQNIWNGEVKDLAGSSDDWWTTIDVMFNTDETKHLSQTGLLERTVPSLLLPKILSNETDDDLKALIGAWAVTIATEQRQKRIDIYEQRPEMQLAMDREIENQPYLNWVPSERPEWLLFEIEQNLTIRRIQIEIANRMIEPPKKDGSDAKHSVMQLNMGEGKTAVIVPISAAVLANGSQLCQITVLKSLFTRNLRLLQQVLGGMLNRRVYTFPCRRDLPVARYIGQMMDIYEECKHNMGVILTLPEYRLSFQLKIYELIEKADIQLAKRFLHAHKWLNANVRNILDESDAILQANYQLIYTVGNQLQLDGGHQRWSVAQAVFKRVPHHMKKFYKRYGSEKIEFDEKYVENGHVFGAPAVKYRGDVFTPCRILEETIFNDLRKALINDFLSGRLDIVIPEFHASTKIELSNILIQKAIDQNTFRLLDHYTQNEQNIILILSGLLRFEVLKLALTRRWRVNYGVDPKGKRKMAIPFKAKDVAAEMTEFGHPDVAICLTQMSYYYSGLTDAQLHQLFNVLENKQNAAAIYENMIRDIPNVLIDSSIQSYSGINLDDPNQRDQLLFPLLRFNMRAIDCWLSNVVFPYEAKVFEKKLMCTAWDLCSEHLKRCVTGFSGTNDTKNILPLSIVQNDLEELENTNEKMRKVLLRKENQSYVSLPPNVSGKHILERLSEEKIPVLLDSGALMLELTNEQVAIEWLKIASDKCYDAAAFFDSRDILQTIDRSGTITEFDCSIYRDNLNRCLVYLDDVHTRGTDLKFPVDWTACVTLSGDITRDKTVQSCMRMRQLGKKHSISFWASYEADIRIRTISTLSPEDLVSNKHVIKFIEENSRQFEVANMVHWTVSGMNYAKKLIAHKLHENSSDKDALGKMYDICMDDEFVKLSEMYGDKVESLLTQIAWSKFDKLTVKFNTFKEVRMFLRDVQTQVFDKLRDQAPDIRQFSNALDEEQEKELEQEPEEQRFSERPPAVKAAIPKLDKGFTDLVLNGANDQKVEAMKSKGVLLSIPTCLMHTKLFRAYKANNADAWASHLYVTRDFDKVITSASQACDEFLRPVWWLARINCDSEKEYILLILSSHECNRLMPTFHNSQQSTLYMYRPRLSKMHSNLICEPELRVSGMDETVDINVHDEVQIGMFAGSMYFQSEAEQNAYCGFMGLIPRPRTKDQDKAFSDGIIQPKGFVPVEQRKSDKAISTYVERCKFNDNPVDLAIGLIEAHHQALIKESHVASILERGVKMTINNQTK